MIGAGVAQVITGVAFCTLMLTLSVAVVKSVVSVGVNSTPSGCTPASNTVPAAGV